MVVKILTGLVIVLVIALAVVTIVYSNNVCNTVEATTPQESVTTNRYAVLTESLQTIVQQLDRTGEDEAEFKERLLELFGGNVLFVDSTDEVVLEDGWDWLTYRTGENRQEKCGRKCYAFFVEHSTTSMSGGTTISFEGNLNLNTNNLTGTIRDHWAYSGGYSGSNVAVISAQVVPVQNP